MRSERLLFEKSDLLPEDVKITLINRSNSLFINGEWHVANGTELTVFGPEQSTPQIVYPDSAWGGFKASSIGRELGPWGLARNQGVRHILSPRSQPLQYGG